MTRYNSLVSVPDQLQAGVVGEAAEPHQQHLAHHLEGHGGAQLGHAHGQVLGDAALVRRGQGKLSQAGHLPGEQH